MLLLFLIISLFFIISFLIEFIIIYIMYRKNKIIKKIKDIQSIIYKDNEDIKKNYQKVSSYYNFNTKLRNIN